MMSGMVCGKPEDARSKLTGHAYRVRIQSAYSFVERNSAKEFNSRHHPAREACQGCGYLLMALTGHGRLPCGFSHLSHLWDVIAARPAYAVGRIRTDMDVEINRADQKVIDDSVFVCHVGLLLPFPDST